MKIITGTLRGRTMNAPVGLETRPTTGRIKESIFNIIQFDIEGRNILDAFGGSGQMAIEAISRGGASGVICETNKKAQAIIQGNIDSCDLSEQLTVLGRDALSHIKTTAKSTYGLIFLDPPYGTELLNEALLHIFEFDILQDGGIIVCESDRSYKLAEVKMPYRVVKEYIYGKTKITTITKE